MTIEKCATLQLCLTQAFSQPRFIQLQFSIDLRLARQPSTKRKCEMHDAPTVNLESEDD